MKREILNLMADLSKKALQEYTETEIKSLERMTAKERAIYEDGRKSGAVQVFDKAFSAGCAFQHNRRVKE